MATAAGSVGAEVHKDPSSAYKDVRTAGSKLVKMSLIKIVNKVELRTEPCGTPLSKGRSVEVASWTRTHIWREDKKPCRKLGSELGSQKGPGNEVSARDHDATQYQKPWQYLRKQPHSNDPSIWPDR